MPRYHSVDPKGIIVLDLYRNLIFEQSFRLLDLYELQNRSLIFPDLSTILANFLSRLSGLLNFFGHLTNCGDFEGGFVLIFLSTSNIFIL